MLRKKPGATHTVQRDVEWHEPRRVDLQVVPGQSKALQVRAHVGFERGVDRQAAQAIDGHEHRVPAACPAPRGGGALHLRVPFRGQAIVRRGDRALLTRKACGA